MSGFRGALRHLLPAVVVVAVLAGCAGEKAHREGLDLLQAGQLEEGLSKLEQATAEAPGNLSFRAELARKQAQAVARLALAADHELAAGRADEAEALYRRVLKLEPDNARARAGLEQVRLHRRHGPLLGEARELFRKGELEAARSRLATVLLEQPAQAEAAALQREIDELLAERRQALPMLQTKLRKPVSLQFRDANLKMVFEALSRTAGVNILLDRDVKSDLKTTIFVKEASVEDTIDLILLQSQLEKKVLNENTVFVYPATAAKLKEYQELKIRSFHLTNADPKQMLAMLKTLLKTRDLYIDERTSSLVMRDTPEAVRLAEKLVAAQDLSEPEVMLELEVLEVGRSRLSELGIRFPDQLTLTAANAAKATTGLTLEELKSVNADRLLVSPAIGATLNLKLQEGDTEVLASPRIRARNREKAKIHIGDRVPVITNTVTPVATGTPVVTGQVQYLDVGLKLEVEPAVHLDGEVAIKVFLEVSSVLREVTNPTSGTIAFQIGTRTASTVLRLKDGETQILAGLIQDEDRKTADKLPGLGQLPVLGRLFSSHRDDARKTELVLSITPHVIRNPQRSEAGLVEFWSGTEASLRTAPLTLPPVGTVKVTATGTAAGTLAPRQSAPPAAAAPKSAAALSWQGPAQAKVGEQFTLVLNMKSTQALSGIPFLVGFDPSALKVVNVAEGDFLKQQNVQAAFSSDVDQPGGRVFVELGNAAEAAPGSGSLVTILFEAIAAKAQTQIALIGFNPTAAPEGAALTVPLPPAHTLAVTP